MRQVRKLTIEQKNTILGGKWDDTTYFNPTLDADNNWFISNEEAEGCINEEFFWVKDLPLIDYNPVIIIIG